MSENKTPIRYRFRVPGRPKPKQSIRVYFRHGKMRGSLAEATRQAMKRFSQLAAKYAPEELLACPIYLHLVFKFAPPKTWPQWKKDAAISGYIHRTKTPDTDNMTKLVKDCLTDLFWTDDKLVVRELVKKIYAKESSTEVTIVTLPQIETRSEYKKLLQSLEKDKKF